MSCSDFFACKTTSFYNSCPGWVDTNNIYYLQDEDIGKSYWLDFDRGYDDHTYYVCTMDLGTNEINKIVEIAEAKDCVDGYGAKSISNISWIGNNIVFYDDGIWSINSNGDNKILLSATGSCPRLSPLGNYIAYVENDNQGWIMNYDGSGNKKVLDFCVESAPCWFTDESKLIFISTDSLKTVDLDGNIVNVISQPCIEGIDISPNSQNLVCLYSKDSTKLIVMNIDGSNRNAIYYEHFAAPIWAPDNVRILGFSRVPDPEYTFSFNLEIALINNDGTGYTKVLDYHVW
jgi:Tol biopolymer transport system component